MTGAKVIYGEWLTLLFTGAGRDSVTGITATATGYLSHYLLTSLADTRILPLGGGMRDLRGSGYASAGA
ncbi:Uncharacterised protein [Pantoea agglomerans]|uniref:Uncharacterized protein n=1 Tax=Enterobacter agglomerans TaxID=549 RepID=A0A379LTE1_ENTAG|nr:Uncharacterised protein [Pantoea agglomerans]